MRLIDLSHRIEHNMPVYPGDTKTNLYQERFLDTDKYNNHLLEINMHAGTHIDSPMHLTDSKKYISELPLNSFIAKGCILNVKNQAVIKYKDEYKELVKENSIVLLYTGFDEYYGTNEYYENHPCIDMELCEFLIGKKIKMLGMDTPSPDKFPFLIHKSLFKNNIYILENLTNLNLLLGVKNFEVIAFPLKINADSSITRAVARVK